VVDGEWVELIPAGTFCTNDGRGPFYNYTPAEVIRLSHDDIPIDFDHATDRAAPKGLPAPAAGWIRAYRVVAGAIQARVEWTAKGAAALNAKEYRFISPVFSFAPPEGAGDVTMGRVIAIARAALVNNPALDQLPALAASRVVQLSALEKKICADLGNSESEYAAAKARRLGQSAVSATATHAPSSPATLMSAINAEIERQLRPLLDEAERMKRGADAPKAELTADERKFCWLFGNSESEFLAAKAKAQRSILADRNDAAAARAQFGPFADHRRGTVRAVSIVKEESWDESHV
jgi:phage I-like protein